MWGILIQTMVEILICSEIKMISKTNRIRIKIKIKMNKEMEWRNMMNERFKKEECFLSI